MDPAGNLYGSAGGPPPSLYGIVYKLDAANNYALSILHAFSGTDGAGPQALIADSSGNLYGTTSDYGIGAGTVFMLDASNNYALTTVHRFTPASGFEVGAPEGAWPVGGLATDASGNLYGMTTRGGTSNYGVIYKLDASHGYALSVLANFAHTSAANSGAALIADPYGNLLGTQTMVERPTRAPSSS